MTEAVRHLKVAFFSDSVYKNHLTAVRFKIESEYS